MISTSSAFSTANAKLQKQPIFLLEIAGYGKVFSNYAGTISGLASHHDWIEESGIAALSITVSDLDGGADLGELSITVQDRGRAITADMPTALFEGKIITLKTGYPGMTYADFALLFTGVIDTVAGASENNAYTFNCTDIGQVLAKVIYTTGDDGQPTDSSHPKTVQAHPLDILADILENKVGIDVSSINLAKILNFKATVFAGAEFSFSIDSPPTAKDFIEQQIMKPLGGYLWVNNKGQFDVNFFYQSGSDFTGLPVSLNPTVLGTALPWLITGGLNPSYGYTLTGGTSPTAVPVTAGYKVTVNYLSGTVAGGLAFAHVDIEGDPSIDGSGPGSPGAHVGHSCNGVCLLASFADGDGNLVEAPHTIDLAGTTLTVPTGATQLLLGTNDGLASDNLGSWLLNLLIVPPSISAPGGTFELTVDNTLEIPIPDQADLVNVVHFRFDKDAGSGKYLADDVLEYAESIARFGSVGGGQLYGEQLIESDGLRSGLQGFYLAEFVARMIFYRYGLKNLLYQNVRALWTASVVEPGDIILVTNEHVPNRQTGSLGITKRPMEVLDREYDFENGIVTLKLLDAGYLSSFGSALIAPNATPDFTGASSDEKTKYMFLASDSDQYSDGTTAQLLA